MINAEFILKASSITNLSDARYFASYGINMIGFCFDPQSANFMNPFRVKEITGWIEGPKIVGEFKNLSVEAINETIISQNLHYAQINLADISPEHATINSVPLIIEVSIVAETNFEKDTIQLEKIFRNNDLVLLNLTRITTLNENTLNDFVKNICSRCPTLIDYNFSSDNISSMVQQFNPAGICLHGSHEEKIGTKSFEALDALMSAIQEEL
jgi:phosphoribosylanthranilate isomerase